MKQLSHAFFITLLPFFLFAIDANVRFMANRAYVAEKTDDRMGVMCT